MKRLIHANSRNFDDLYATPGRIAALNEIDWQIEDDDVDLLSRGADFPDTYFQAIPIRKPIARIEYEDGTLNGFVVTYEDGVRSRYAYKEGSDSDERQRRYYWTYLGKA